jgi:protein O-GlcNAc transferase
VIGLPKDLRIAREEIKAAKLDILIYPELGMDKTTFFLAFHRLAPVQAVWWGNADTSGIPTIDYFLSSEYEHANCQEHYTENVYQLKYVILISRRNTYNISFEVITDSSSLL